MLGLELGRGVLLPHVVESSEQEDRGGAGGERALDRRNGSGLVGWGWDCLVVGLPLPWPAGLSDDDGLVLVCEHGLQSWDLAGEERAGVCGGGVAIEEGVAVDGAVVGGIAERWVGTSGNEGINSDDLSVVASGLQKPTDGANGSNDLGSGGGTIVDKLVSDRDGIELAPVTLSGGDDDFDLRFEGVDIEDTSEQLHSLGLGGSENGSNLVAVGSVDSDFRVSISNLIQVSGDLVLRLASAIIVVWRVGQSESTAP